MFKNFLVTFFRSHISRSNLTNFGKTVYDPWRFNKIGMEWLDSGKETAIAMPDLKKPER